MARQLLEESSGVPYPSLLLSDRAQFDERRVEEWVGRLLEGEPIQYVLGVAYFAGMRLSVRPGVLIPRPETEELCDLITREVVPPAARRAIDLCTGSGCIALALARELGELHVTALDISEVALEVVRENIQREGLEERIELRQGDLLSPDFRAEGQFDLVVSNPPYVLEHEAEEMLPHVLDHEPEEALFVPNEDGILFYRRILELYVPQLNSGGVIAFELNPLTAQEVLAEGARYGLKGTLRQDLCGRERFYIGRR